MTATVMIGGIEYQPVKDDEPSEWRIVIAQRGWVFVGRYLEDGDDVTLTDAAVLRKWGTTKGLGELSGGPLAETVVDLAGTVRLHRLAVVATLDCGEGWGS